MTTLHPPSANTGILAVGDFYQLCPVCAQPLYVKRNAQDINDLTPSLWSSLQFMELTKIVRQCNDEKFAQLLNSVRPEVPSEDSWENKLLQSRGLYISQSDSNYPHEVMHIYATNKTAAQYNEVMLQKCSGQLYSFASADTVKEQNTQLFNVVIPSEYQKTGRLLKHLHIKIGSRVMLTNNIHVSDGLTNGAIGTVYTYS